MNNKQLHATIDRLFGAFGQADVKLYAGKIKRVPLPVVFASLGEIDLTLLLEESPDNAVDDKGWGAFNPTEVTTPELVWPLDQAFAVPNDEGWTKGTLQFVRVKTIDAKTARSMGAMLFSKYMVTVTCCTLEPDNTAHLTNFALGWIGKRWIMLDKSPNTEGFDTKIKVAQSVALTERYFKHAVIRNDSGLAFRITMNVSTAQSFFKLREVPEGKRRRAALRNWVNEHIRITPSDELTTVREHLRNRVAFDWDGFSCEYRPSEYDEQRNEDLAHVH